MNAFELTLGPKAIGAEVLVHVAQARATGTLSWGARTKRRQLVFKEGRPEMLLESDGSSIGARDAIVAGVRAFGATSAGKCRFIVTPPTATATATATASLGIDTLGEALIAVLRNMTPAQLDSFWTARGAQRAEPSPTFKRVAAAVAKLTSDGELSFPEGTVRVANFATRSSHEQRAWAAMLALGAVTTDGPAIDFNTPPSDDADAAGAKAIDASTPAGALSNEIRAAFAAHARSDHYQLLGVGRGATHDEVRKAYFRLAKEWHSDRLISLGVGDDARAMAEDLFRRADEAHRVLTDDEEHKSYDWMRERQAKGLPTEPRIILEAETLFRKGESMVRRGQAVGAEPVLRQAVELNRGEAEFWAYLGFAIYHKLGTKGVDEAKRAIDEAFKLSEKLAVGHEFLGRIYHAEGDIENARTHFEKCLALSPKNPDAKRELRLLTMRQQERAAKKKAGGAVGLLSRLFKRG